MQAVKLKAHVRSDTTLEWDEPLPKLPPGEVEVIVLYEQTAKEQSQHGASPPHADAQKTAPSEQPQPAQSPRSNQAGKKQDGFWINQLCDALSDATKAIGMEELNRQKHEISAE